MVIPHIDCLWYYINKVYSISYRLPVDFGAVLPAREAEACRDAVLRLAVDTSRDAALRLAVDNCVVVRVPLPKLWRLVDSLLLPVVVLPLPKLRLSVVMVVFELRVVERRVDVGRVGRDVVRKMRCVGCLHVREV